MIVSGFFMFIMMGNGYWRENAPYRIGSVNISAKLDDDGLLHVRETSLYSLSRSNRTASKRLHLSYPAVLESYLVKIEETAGFVREVSSSPGGFDVRVFLNENIDQFTMTTEYKLIGVIESGSDIAVLRYRFWEPNSDAMTRNVSLSLELPEKIARNLTRDRIFVRPFREARVAIEGNKVTLYMRSVLSSASCEIMILFPRSLAGTMKHAINTTISTGMIKKENEANMFQQAFLSGLIGFQIAVPIFVLFFTFILFGIEPQVKSEAGYLMNSAPGYLLNAVVKNPFQEADVDGFLATLVELNNRGDIHITEKSIEIKSVSTSMPTQQQWAVQTVKSLGESSSGEIEIPDVNEPDLNTEDFHRHYNFWQKHTMKVVRSGRFYENLGSIVMSVFSVFFMIAWSLILKFLFANWQVYLSFPDETLIVSIVLYINWTLGWLLLRIPKSIFGRWTPSGRLFYMEWKSIENDLLKGAQFSDEDLAKLIALGHMQTLIADRKRVTARQLTVMRTLQKLEMLLTDRHVS
jgi:uncharacterized membrane protein